MKRLCWLLCLILLLTGCAVKEAEVSAVTELIPVTEQLQETQPQVILSHEIAMLEGYVVIDEGDVRHNAGNWVEFLDACEAGENAAVTVVSFTLEEGGYTHVKYDLTFDGSVYTLEYVKNGVLNRESATELVRTAGLMEADSEPYDSFEQYALNDVVVYTDLIAEPDFEGVREIHLHAKEGEPPVKSYTADALQPVLELLWNAEYVPSEPDDYVYGMKLLMTNREGKELVIELDLKQGYYRYGMQNYHYGEVEDLFAVLQIEAWPDSVLEEFKDFLN